MGSSEADAVKIEQSIEGVTIITIDRQQRRNAVDSQTAQILYDAFLAFENDASQKVCVFQGAHGTFCAGADLHAIAQGGSQGPLQMPRVADRNAGPMGPSRLQVKKPVIAAVSGYAVAGGLELSLLADMRVVEEDAIFGVFCRRWGVPLIDGGTVRLQAVVGLGRAMDLHVDFKAMMALTMLTSDRILTGRPVGAKEALEMGLANRVVPKGRALEEALAIARQLLQFPMACMLADRASAFYSAYKATSFEDALSNEFDNGVKVVTTEGIKGASRFSSGLGRGGSYEKL